MAYSIPVIDLQDFPGNMKKLMKASEEWGCFRIVNFESILPKSLMDEMRAVVISLLELPYEIKQRNVDVIEGSGYRFPDRINPIHEGFGLYDAASSEAVNAFCALLNATPQQRTVTVREIITRYGRAVYELSMAIGRKLGEGLGLTDVSFKKWPSQFRINKYPFTPENIDSDGLRPHTDNSFLTILQEDEQFGGLEVMQRSGKLVQVEPCPGTLIINLGDLAQVWSNGRFYNVKHRVSSKQAGIRITIATFLLGPREEAVEAPSELVTSDNPRRYVPFKFEDYWKSKFYKCLDDGEALNPFRIESAEIVEMVVVLGARMVKMVVGLFDDLEQNIHLREISKQQSPQDVSPELFSVLQDVKKAMVSFQIHEQRRDAAQLIEVDRIFQVFDGLVQKASALVKHPDCGGGGEIGI
ncbi:hypothetical protein BUALT_Bualt07G0009800 [Buddleja alternifolia]|uniref:Fe2OG dioxygenase domain-containing protein n=1 Tax=Buddleja alternifolia TaxID=168488 RepID=A0AAV6X8C2_9LAMI|nr:hypothetical protein BUALT_Bualt07G0009800 [Buddleja alternifolia]